MVSFRGDLGEGAGGGLLPFRDSTPADAKGPLCTILIYPFLVTDPKIFLKAFFAFFGLFFQIFGCAAEISAKTESS